MKPVTGNAKVARVLSLPQDQRTGTVSFLVDRWHRTAQSFTVLEGETARLEQEAAEARTQLTKVRGALEILELMIAEHEEPVPQAGPQGPRPVPDAASAAGHKGKKPGDKNGGE